MRTLILFIHILSASMLIGGLVLQIVFVPLAYRYKRAAEGRWAIFLQARASHFINPAAAVVVFVSGYYLAQAYGGIRAQVWIWVSLGLFILCAALVAISGKQEERLGIGTSELDWSRFFKLWIPEMVLSVLAVACILYLMIAKTI